MSKFFSASTRNYRESSSNTSLNSSNHSWQSRKILPFHMPEIFFSWNWPFINSTASLLCPPEAAHSRAAQSILLPIHIPTSSWAKMAIVPFWLVCFIVRSSAAFNQNKCINHLLKQIKYCIHSTKWLFSHFFSLLKEVLHQQCVNIMVTSFHLPSIFILPFQLWRPPLSLNPMCPCLRCLNLSRSSNGTVSAATTLTILISPVLFFALCLDIPSMRVQGSV